MGGMLQFDPNDPYQLELMRQKMPRNDMMHGVLGPQSHKQFTQEVVANNPMMALPMLAATPAYTAGKAMGFFPDARSPASIDEIFAGWEGVGRGMGQSIEGMLAGLISEANAGPAQGDARRVEQSQSRRGMLHSPRLFPRSAQIADPSLRRSVDGSFPPPQPVQRRQPPGGGGVRG